MIAADAVRIVNALQSVNANIKAERDALQRRIDYILSPEAVEHAAEHAYLVDSQFGTWGEVSDDERARYLARARVFLGSLDREATAWRGHAHDWVYDNKYHGSRCTTCRAWDGDDL